MNRLFLFSWVLFLLCGCSGAPGFASTSSANTTTQDASWLSKCAAENAVKGTPADLTLVSGETSGITFDAPRFCPGNNGQEGAFIRVVHHGKRKLNYHPEQEGPCDRPDADAIACPTVSVHVFGMAVLESLWKHLGQTRADSYGIGLCARSQDPLEKWNLGSHIHDWNDANVAIRLMDAELTRWDIEGEWGLSITGITCAVAL
jgi:hypothetical protein